jgi:AGZA family xanthine/uracil permease-like MFS transporter
MNGAIIYGIAGMSILAWVMGTDLVGMPVSDPYNMLGNADPTYDFYNNPEVTTTIGFAMYEGIDFTIFHAPAGWGDAVATAPELGFGDGKMISTEALTATGAVGAALGALGDIGAEGGTSIGDFILIMIAFMFVDIFDTAGTLYSVGRAAGYVDENDELQNSDEAFMSDAAATIVGALVGTSTTTTYIESAAGVEEGGKTGLTAVTVGVLMLSGLFMSGLFKAIPQFAMATALVVVGALMMKQVADIDWGNQEIAIPAFLTMVLMPFTFSIADGIAWGIISYVAIQLMVGKAKDVNVVMWTLFALMSMFYLGPGEHTTFEWLVDLVGL